MNRIHALVSACVPSAYKSMFVCVFVCVCVRGVEIEAQKITWKFYLLFWENYLLLKIQNIIENVQLSRINECTNPKPIKKTGKLRSTDTSSNPG